jgi:hypothetical protein
VLEGRLRRQAARRSAGGQGHCREARLNTAEQVAGYINGQPEPKRADLEALHRRIVKLMPKGKLWFLDGRDSSGKIVSNPNIGYGSRTMTYADGKTREFYQIGLSANSTGISVYILGIDDKTYLANTFGKTLGKASVSGYCIKFRHVKDIDLDVLDTAIRQGIAASARA